MLLRRVPAYGISKHIPFVSKLDRVSLYVIYVSLDYILGGAPEHRARHVVS
jgi:hypothetical protein